MRKKLGIASIVAVAALGSAALFDANAPHLRKNPPILQSAQLPDDVRSTFERSCQDCHSNNTYWPVYSKLPVVSELIQEDVAKGRATMNLSNWQCVGSA